MTHNTALLRGLGMYLPRVERVLVQSLAIHLGPGAPVQKTGIVPIHGACITAGGDSPTFIRPYPEIGFTLVCDHAALTVDLADPII
jgi:hypothetical protein